MAGNVSVGLRQPTTLRKALFCETTGSDTTAEHPKHIDDPDLLPPITVTPAEQQRILRGSTKNKQQIPQFL